MTDMTDITWVRVVSGGERLNRNLNKLVRVFWVLQENGTLGEQLVFGGGKLGRVANAGDVYNLATVPREDGSTGYIIKGKDAPVWLEQWDGADRNNIVLVSREDVARHKANQLRRKQERESRPMADMTLAELREMYRKRFGTNRAAFIAAVLTEITN